MYTFIFICILISLIVIANMFIRNSMEDIFKEQSITNSTEKEKLLAKKTMPVINIGLLIMVIGILYINFWLNTNDVNSKNQDKENEIVTEELLQEEKLSEKEQFLVDNNFKTDAELSDSQFIELKKLIDSGIFKDESFCDVFQKSLDISNNSKNSKEDLKKFYKKYEHIPAFEVMLSFYGYDLCEVKKISTNKGYSSNYIHNSDASPCVISEDFIKQDLHYPTTASFSSLNCSTEENADGTYTVLRKISAENALGVEKEYIYKVKIGFKGGNWVDINNWDLISIRSEEYR